MLLKLRPQDIVQARSQEFFPTQVKDIALAQHIHDRCMTLLDQLGFRVDVKRRDSRYSSTLFGHVWWSSNCDGKKIEQKAKVATHETVHSLQQSRQPGFEILKYSQPRQLATAEIQAYGAGLRVLRQMGFSYDEIVTEARRNAASLWKDYLPVRLIPRSSFDKHTVKSLLSHAGLEFEGLA